MFTLERNTNIADIKFEIKEKIGVLSSGARGWSKKLNMISWNGATPKFDIRDWAPGHEKWVRELRCPRKKQKRCINYWVKRLENKYVLMKK